MHLKEWIAEHKYLLVAMLFLLGGGLYYYDIYQPDTNAQSQKIATAEKSVASSKSAAKQTAPQRQAEQVKTVMVDVKGEIKRPGVYQARESERVNDIIQRAGGLKAKADEKQVNFAAHVQDEMVIYIPAKGETNSTPLAAAGASASTVSGNGSGTNNGKININKAAETELETLPGIGPAKAAAIIEYRNTNGSFQTAEDLKKISGIGEKTFAKLKDSISVK